MGRSPSPSRARSHHVILCLQSNSSDLFVETCNRGNRLAFSLQAIEGLTMRALVALAIIITTTIGLGGGWWHHQAAVVSEPAPPLKFAPSS